MLPCRPSPVIWDPAENWLSRPAIRLRANGRPGYRLCYAKPSDCLTARASRSTMTFASPLENSSPMRRISASAQMTWPSASILCASSTRPGSQASHGCGVQRARLVWRLGWIDGRPFETGIDRDLSALTGRLRRAPFRDEILELKSILAGLTRSFGKASGLNRVIFERLLGDCRVMGPIGPFIEKLDAIFRFSFELHGEIMGRIAD